MNNTDIGIDVHSKIKLILFMMITENYLIITKRNYHIGAELYYVQQNKLHNYLYI